MAGTKDDKSPTTEGLTGDPDVFEALIRQHQHMIHSLCYRMTGSMADAEDLAQETFIQAFQHLGEFRREAQPGSWLYRIAVNHCLNWHKRQRRLRQLHQDWAQQESGSFDDNALLAQQVQDALMKLDAKQRAAIVLTTYDGLTHAEAARTLGCSETTISWRLFAARGKLKRMLKHLQNTGGAA